MHGGIGSPEPLADRQVPPGVDSVV